MTVKKSTKLRELINREEILFRPGVALPIHAQMAEALGFEAVGVSGGNTATHLFGLPDAGFTTLTEVVENVRRIANSVDIPVMADCDTGFGNAINVRRTVAEVIRAGAAGLFIEDQVFPKRCGYVKGKEMISMEEAVGKFRAALDQRDAMDPDFVIIARCDAMTAVDGGMDELIRRARAYKETGVDVLYIESMRSREEIETIRAAVDGPIACSVSAMEPYPSLEEMQELGLCMTVSTMFFKVGLIACWDLLADMKQRGLAPFVEFRESIKDHPLGGYGMFDLTGFADVAEWEKKYLPPEQLARYELSEGVYDPREGHNPFRKVAQSHLSV